MYIFRFVLTLALVSFSTFLVFAEEGVQGCQEGLPACEVCCSMPEEGFDARLDALWLESLGYHADLATVLGVEGAASGGLGESGVSQRQRLDQIHQEFQERLDSLEPEIENFEQRLSWQVFQLYLASERRAYRSGRDLFLMSHQSGPQLLTQYVAYLPIRNKKDTEDYFRFVEGIPRYLKSTKSSLKEAVKRDRVLPKVVVDLIRPQVKKTLDFSLDRWQDYPLASRLKECREVLSEKEYQQLCERFRSLLEKEVVPAYRDWASFLDREYFPYAPDQPGLQARRGGEDLYRDFILYHVGLEMDPKEIHQLGLKEVEKNDRELGRLQQKLGIKGSLRDFFETLRNDKSLYFTDKESYLQYCRAFAKKIDYRLPKLFRTFPAIPYGVEEMSSHLEASAPTAYYIPSSVDGTRAGAFVVNTSKPETRPRYEVPVLTIHEAVPGHHFQISIARKIQDLAMIRRQLMFTGYTEGWGLYSERLGWELGLYEDLYDQVGFYSYDAWRSCRLVVDTGLHSMGWSRQQAIDYMLAHTAKSRHDIETEVDRYIAWPGQALAYKIGQLKILEMREEAKKRLGQRWDIKEFHDMLLDGGALPLMLLEERFHRWLSKKEEVSS